MWPVHQIKPSSTYTSRHPYPASTWHPHVCMSLPCIRHLEHTSETTAVMVSARHAHRRRQLAQPPRGLAKVHHRRRHRSHATGLSRLLL